MYPWFPRASSFLQPSYMPACHFLHPEEELFNTGVLYYGFIYIYIYYVMYLFERGCPKILTWAPLPKHQALCNLPVSFLLLRCSRDNFPQFGVGCSDHSHALVLTQATGLSCSSGRETWAHGRTDSHQSFAFPK